MPSPFPGMDPWLEGSLFGDLHEILASYLRESLNAALPEGYAATMRQIVVSNELQRRIPDVGIVETEETFGDPFGASPVATLPGLATLAHRLRPVEWEESHVEILDTSRRRLVTSIEVLSPSNKRSGSKGRAEYAAKQAELIEGGVHLVEIDLLRGGTFVSAVPRSELEQVCPEFDYHVGVTTSARRITYHVAAWKLSSPLPAIGIPLDSEAAPVVVSLQPLLDRAYETGRYGKLTDYKQPADPPLTTDQQVWAEAILKDKGLIP